MDIDYNLLHSSFSIPYLRPYQELIIRTILESYETGERKNILGILPTGSGKSLCFMYPLKLLRVRAILIYPLLSLMADQKERFDRAGIPSVVLRGGLERKERERRTSFLRKHPDASVIANPEILLYMLERDEFSFLRHTTRIIVIDEAHTAITWGRSFRRSYLELPRIINAVSPEIVLAFTATADRSIGKGILESVFSGRNVHIVHSSPDRENIFYRVITPLSKERETVRILEDPSMRPAVIFLSQRILAERLASVLSSRFDARCYHAGLPAEERREKEEWFLNSADGVLAATCAYGMGVDKKNIRTVIHWSCPEDAASFMQESGRAGRDGQLSYSYVFLSDKDTSPVRSAFTAGCIRKGVLAAMGEEAGNDMCTACSYCLEEKSIRAGEMEIRRYVRTHPLIRPENAAAALAAKHWLFRKKRLPAWTEKEVLKAIRILQSEGAFRTFYGRLILK